MKPNPRLAHDALPAQLSSDASRPSYAGAPHRESVEAPPGMYVDDYARQDRCRRCKLSPSLCLCYDLVSVEFPIRILIVQHWTERKSISNTGSLLPLLLDHAEVITYAHPSEPFDPTPLQGNTSRMRLLYPHPDAEELSATTFAWPSPQSAPFASASPQLRPTSCAEPSPCAEPSSTYPNDDRPTLVVLDATWPKAQRMTRRVAPLHRLRAVCLPSVPVIPDVAESHGDRICEGRPSVLRRRHLPERLSTLESVLQALAALGHRHPTLEQNAKELLRRRLHLMGRIPRHRLGL